MRIFEIDKDVELNSRMWKFHSGSIIAQMPELFDPEKFNWDDFSFELVIFLPEKIDNDKLCWGDISINSITDKPFLFNKEYFEWERLIDLIYKKKEVLTIDSLRELRNLNFDFNFRLRNVLKEHPETCSTFANTLQFWTTEASWMFENHDCALEMLRGIPRLFDPDTFNWEDFSGLILKEAPQFFDPDKFNWKDFSLQLVKTYPEFISPKKLVFSKEVVGVLLKKFEFLEKEILFAINNSSNENSELLTHFLNVEHFDLLLEYFD